MRTCTKCQCSFEEAHKKEYMCKPCKRVYDKEHYEKHKQRYSTIKNSHSRNRRLRNMQYVVDYLRKNACCDCGETDFIVLEFDHKKDKHNNIAEMIKANSLKMIKDEIAKCDVVCANCHKRRTAKQFNYYQGIT